MEDSLQQAMTWIELELAALWMEIYTSNPDLDEIPRRQAADRIYSDRTILLSLFDEAARWDQRSILQRLTSRTSN